MTEVADPSVHTATGLRETEAQRLDRNFTQLLQELRVVQTGVQLLFGFLLAATFTPVFDRLGDAQRAVFAATMVAATASMALLVGPVAVHRLVWRRGLKPVVVRVAHVMTIAGMAALVLALTGAAWLALERALGDGWAVTMTAVCVGALVVCWLVVPMLLCRKAQPRVPDGD